MLTASEEASLREAWQDRHNQVIEAGGLHVLGTERNESRRVDNQLRGRCGRQGDPGSSRFYLSMEDNLMRIFGSDRVSNLMQKLGMEEGEAIEHTWVTRAIENSQRKVEGRNFDIRKQLLEFDDVANEQRKVVYEQRNTLMDVDDISDHITQVRSEVINDVTSRSIPPQSMEEQWDLEGLEKDLADEFGVELPVSKWLKEDESLHEESLRERIEKEIVEAYEKKGEAVGEDVMRHLEKAVMLKVLDEQWKEHLANMDHLRQGIGLRSYAQKNPKQEYKRESFELFTSMLDRVRHEVIKILSKIQIQTESEVESMEAQRREAQKMEFLHPDANAAGMPPEEEAEFAGEPGQPAVATKPVAQPYVRAGRKVGRNEPCPCGSGKKYKQCHGKLN